MTAGRWPRINELFEAALQRAPVARSAFVAGECGSDEDLRREVESLLAAHAVADGFLSAAPPDGPPPFLPAGDAPRPLRDPGAARARAGWARCTARATCGWAARSR